MPVSASLLIYIWSSEDTAASEAACGLLVTVRFYLVYWWFNASYINVCFRWIVRKMLLLRANDELTLLLRGGAHCAPPCGFLRIILLGGV